MSKLTALMGILFLAVSSAWAQTLPPPLRPALPPAAPGDGAYDQAGVYGTVAERHPDADVIVPPRSRAGLSKDVEIAPTRRDRHLQSIHEHGRRGWQKRSGYTLDEPS
jgi:hypothetical protein